MPRKENAVTRFRYGQSKIDAAPDTILVDAGTVAVIGEQQRWLRVRFPGRDLPYLFPQRRANAHAAKPYGNTNYGRALALFSELAQITDASGHPVKLSHTHRFRHTKLTKLAELGLPVHVLQRYAGHANHVHALRRPPRRARRAGVPGHPQVQGRRHPRDLLPGRPRRAAPARPRRPVPAQRLLPAAAPSKVREGQRVLDLRRLRDRRQSPRRPPAAAGADDRADRADHRAVPRPARSPHARRQRLARPARGRARRPGQAPCRDRPAPAGPSREQAAQQPGPRVPSTPTATGSHSHDRLTPAPRRHPTPGHPPRLQEPRRRPRRPRSAPWSSAASRSPSSPSSAKPTCPTPFSTETLNSETGSNGSATRPARNHPRLPTPAVTTRSSRPSPARSLISRNNTATKPRPFGPRSNRPTARTWNSGASSPAAAGTRSPQRRNNVTSIATTI